MSTAPGSDAAAAFLAPPAAGVTLFRGVRKAERAVVNLREATEQAKAAIGDFRGDKGPVRGAALEMQQAMSAARDTRRAHRDASSLRRR